MFDAYLIFAFSTVAMVASFANLLWGEPPSLPLLFVGVLGCYVSATVKRQNDRIRLLEERQSAASIT